MVNARKHLGQAWCYLCTRFALRVSTSKCVRARAFEDLASLVSSADTPNPNQQTDNELLERAKRLAGQISDPKVVTIVSALLIAEAIRFGSGRIT